MVFSVKVLELLAGCGRLLEVSGFKLDPDQHLNFFDSKDSQILQGKICLQQTNSICFS